MAKRISIYSVRLIKEKTGLYELEYVVIRNSQIANDVIKKVLDINNSTVEKFGIITLTVKNKIAGVHIISVGNLNSSIVHPREIFQQAILNNASAIILFHNHPSGDPTESTEDIEITKRLIEAGDILGIKVIDHIIVGEDNKYISFKAKGICNI
ncbi:MAG TPA: JAB domain-containing protein [Clostridiales bacterium]|nr:JAB domain-containing protein [Clostridiales bacterium]